MSVIVCINGHIPIGNACHEINMPLFHDMLLVKPPPHLQIIDLGGILFSACRDSVIPATF